MGNEGKHEQLQTGILRGSCLTESLQCLNMPTQSWDRDKIKAGKEEKRDFTVKFHVNDSNFLFSLGIRNHWGKLKSASIRKNLRTISSKAEFLDQCFLTENVQ